MSMREVGARYLAALEEAKDAQRKYETNDGDNYDPCGETARRVKLEFEGAIHELASATKALLEYAQ